MYEEKFILNAARLDLSDENIAVLKDVSSKNIDWNMLFQKALFNGVSTLIYYSLKKHNLTHILPDDLFSKLKEIYCRVSLQNLKFIKKIHELSRMIEEKTVLLKGGYLIQCFYPDIGIRSMGDIDILVDKKKALYVWNVLKSHGLENRGELPVFSKSAVHERVIQRQHLDHLWSGDCIVEVHQSIFENPCFDYITKKAMESAVPLGSNNKLYRLSNTFFLVHLCNHFYLHNYMYKQKGSNLRMLCDINEFILKRTLHIDWNEIEKTCSISELKNRMSTVLTYVNFFFQTPVPDNFLMQNMLTKHLTTALLDSDMTVLEKQNRILSLFFLRLKSFNKNRHRFIFVFRTFFPSRKWICHKYNTENNKGVLTGYFSYWADLLSRYVLNRKVQ